MFFQTLVAGDSWGACTLPVIRASTLAFVIFAGALVCVQLGFMNLILAVIVERARTSHEDIEQRLKDKAKFERKAASKLKDIFAAIDYDQNGLISLEEVLAGYENNKALRNIFNMLDIDKNDITALFKLMDTDDEGELSFQHWIDTIRAASSQDNRKQLMMTRLQISEIARVLKSRKPSKSHSLMPISPNAVAQFSAANSPQANHGKLLVPCHHQCLSYQGGLGSDPFSLSNLATQPHTTPHMSSVEQELAALRMSLDQQLVAFGSNILKMDCASASSFPVDAAPAPSCLADCSCETSGSTEGRSSALSATHHQDVNTQQSDESSPGSPFCQRRRGRRRSASWSSPQKGQAELKGGRGGVDTLLWNHSGNTSVLPTCLPNELESSPSKHNKSPFIPRQRHRAFKQ